MRPACRQRHRGRRWPSPRTGGGTVTAPAAHVLVLADVSRRRRKRLLQRVDVDRRSGTHDRVLRVDIRRRHHGDRRHGDAGLHHGRLLLRAADGHRRGRPVHRIGRPRRLPPAARRGRRANFTFSPSVAGPERRGGVRRELVDDATRARRSWTSPGTSATARRSSIVRAAPCCITPGPTEPGFRRIPSRLAQTFVVNLVVTDSAGRIGSRQYVESPSPSREPTVVIYDLAELAERRDHGQLQLERHDLLPRVGARPAASFVWTFGDGTGATARQCASRMPTRAVGTYTVSLSVTDNKGRTGMPRPRSRWWHVTPPTPPLHRSRAFTIRPPCPPTAGAVGELRRVDVDARQAARRSSTTAGILAMEPAQRSSWQGRPVLDGTVTCDPAVRMPRL